MINIRAYYYYYYYVLHQWCSNYSSHEEYTLVIIVILSLLLLLFRYLIIKLLISKRQITTTTLSLPPGPSPWPIIGNIPELLWNRPLWLHHQTQKLNTDIACIRIGTATHLIIVTSPEIAREFLTKHDAMFASRPDTLITCLITKGYLTTVLNPWGNQWKKMRRVMSQILNRSTLAWLLPKRTQEADNLVRFVYNQAMSSNSGGDGGVVNVRVAARQYSAGVLRRMIFDRRYFGQGRVDGGPGKEEEEHVEALFTILSHVYTYSASDILPIWLRWFDFDGYQRTVGEALKVIGRHQDELVKQRIGDGDNNSNINDKPEDLLDVLISLKHSDGNPLLSPDEIRAQITEMFIAVVDNPYNVAEWALSEMLNQPEMLQKATEEIDRVVGNGTTLLQESHLPQLPYLMACAREALRLHPVTAFNVPHVSTADCNVASYFIPKGSHVLLSRLGLGRNPSIWDQPLRFNPSRHLLEKRHDLGETDLRFISFTRGRRGCIGTKMGTNMTLMLLGRLIQGFTWKIPKGMKKIDLRSEEGNTLYKATPLYAHAKPRFNRSFYISLS